MPSVPKLPHAELQQNSTFDPQCGHERKLAECEGFETCLHATDGHTDEWFIAKQRERRSLPLEPIIPRCTQATCFDRTRCVPPFKIYVYKPEEIPQALRTCVNEPTFDEESTRKYITDDPARACIFWIEKPGKCPRNTMFKDFPHWGRDGLNNFIKDSGDKGVSAEDRTRYLGRAMMAFGHATYERFVPRFDIALTLRAHVSLPKVEKLMLGRPPWQRKWLLTFKGTFSHAARRRAMALHDEKRRVVVAGYPHFHNCDPTTTPARPLRNQGGITVPLLHASCCQRMKSLYSSYNFMDLMNSTFALVLPGRQPASYRLAEVMAAGAIPVFFGFETAFRPYEEVIDWPKLSLSAPSDVDPELLLRTLERLADDHDKLAAMQHEAMRVYREYIGSEGSDKMNRAILEILRRRFEFENRRSRRLGAADDGGDDGSGSEAPPAHALNATHHFSTPSAR